MNLIDAFSSNSQRGQKYVGAVLKHSRNGDKIKQFDRTWTLTNALRMLDCGIGEFRRACEALGLSDGSTGSLRTTFDLQQLNQIRATLPNRKAANKQLPKLCIMSGKGGCSKTTYTVHLAQYLVLQGNRVLVIDTDPQASATSLILGVNPDVTFTADDTVAPFMMGRETDLQRSVLRTGMPGLDLVPCCQGAAIMDLQGIRRPGQTQHDAVLDFWRFASAVDEFSSQYDMVLIDTPPTLTHTNIKSAIAANLIITPIAPSMLDLCSSTGFETTMSDFIQSLLEVNDALPQYLYNRRFLVSRYDHRLSAHRTYAELIRKTYPTTYHTPFQNLTEIANADKSGNTVYDQQRAVNSSSTRKKALDHLDMGFL